MRKGIRPYRGFGYLSFFCDPIDLATWGQKNVCNFANFNRVVDRKTSINQISNESKPGRNICILNVG